MLSRVLFWDFDGTLIHPNESFLSALKDAFASKAHKVSEETLSAFLRSVCTWYKPEIAYVESTGTIWWNDFFRNCDIVYEHNGISETDWQEMHRVFKDTILNARNYTLYDDAKETLRTCQTNGYKNYILSNNFPELPAVIADLGLAEFFTDYIVSSNIGYEKPRVEIFQYALRIADYPSLCYMIGDNPVADIQGGKNAGIKTILVHHKPLHEANDDEFICENLFDITSIV